MPPLGLGFVLGYHIKKCLERITFGKEIEEVALKKC
jgi:hypothetical protein